MVENITEEFPDGCAMLLIVIRVRVTIDEIGLSSCIEVKGVRLQLGSGREAKLVRGPLVAIISGAWIAPRGGAGATDDKPAIVAILLGPLGDQDLVLTGTFGSKGFLKGVGMLLLCA
jgi:hypothetical protein